MQPSEITRPIVYAGPCMAESLELLEAVAKPLSQLSQELNFDFTFKASFDKANRTSVDSYRGPGLDQAMKWFDIIKKKYGVKILTDIHESHQAKACAPVVDVLQIPAFLCRQTDLLVAACETGRMVNIKKGQMVAPDAMINAVDKARAACLKKNLPLRVALTERGACFGYGNLVVDMRAFPIMREAGVPVIFDITHSTQLPATGDGGKTTGGDRRFAPVLARAAVSTGYVDGFFLEVHLDPKLAKSDKAVQLSLSQAEVLLRQILPIWRQSRTFSETDKMYRD
jgi:2-dehydro-3-deoxyphosphooctonate aldolase (KDO 8-P synthase)